MIRYEITNAAGETINTILATAEFVEAHYPGHYRVAPEDVFVAPPEHRHISVGAFFDRFGAAKYAILADTAPAVQALIKDASVRQFIDLDRVDLPAGLQMLVDAGHTIDPAAILSAPIESWERP